jgi:hypothetical protein
VSACDNMHMQYEAGNRNRALPCIRQNSPLEIPKKKKKNVKNWNQELGIMSLFMTTLKSLGPTGVVEYQIRCVRPQIQLLDIYCTG